jgi:hypothetical protein
MKLRRFVPLDRTKDQTISEMTARGVTIRRTLQRVGTEKLIIIHREHLLPIDSAETNLHHLIFGDPSRYEGSGNIYSDPDDEWTAKGAEMDPRFNCAAFALGEKVGLTPNDWIEGEPTDISEDTNPAEILLKAYFKPIKIVDATLNAVAPLASDPQIWHDDVVSYTLHRPKWGIVHRHMGKIKIVDNENWLISKFAQSRIVVLPLTEVLQIFPDVEKVRIYRAKS